MDSEPPTDQKKPSVNQPVYDLGDFAAVAEIFRNKIQYFNDRSKAYYSICVFEDVPCPPEPHPPQVLLTN